MSEQRYGEDVELGDELGPMVKAPGPAQVLQFLEIWPEGEDKMNGRFLNLEAAREAGFDKPIVPGNMSVAYLAQLVTDWGGPDARLRSMNANYRRPALHNDEVRCVGLVTDTREEGDRTLVRLDVYLENNRGDRPVQGTAEVDLPTRRAD
jgi:hypothetical protein